MKKGLVLVYDPHNLLQFIWYYCTYGMNKQWDALCLPNGDMGEYMSEYCKKSEIFENVITDNKSFLHTPVKEEIKIFSKMLMYALIEKQEKYCKEELDKYVNTDDYDEFVVLTDVGLVSGYFVAMSDKKRVVILEDGTGDYLVRKNNMLLKHLFRPADWKGFILANLGYANVGHTYPLRTTRKCIKFCSHIDIMPYKQYKTMLKLYDFEKTNMDAYNNIINKIYKKIDLNSFNEYDTVLFTCNLADFVTDTEELRKKTNEYIASCSKNVLIKKHPRDIMEYDFGDNVKITEIDQSIPGEVILPYIKGKKILFMQATSIMLYMDSNEYNSECLYYEGLYEKSIKENTYFDYITREELKRRLISFKCENISIKNI